MSAPVNKWLVLIGTGLMIILANLDTSIVNLALAPISQSLKIGLEDIQWILNSYFLSAAIFFIICGKLAYIYGKKKIFLVGVVLFLISSIVASYTDNFVALIVARIVQGIGFAFTVCLAVVMTTESFSPEHRGFAAGIIVTITGVSQAIGPSLGGIILKYMNWHWIFLINIPICLISFIVTNKSYPHDNGHTAKFPLHSSYLMSVGLFLILLACNQWQSWGFISPKFIACLCIGIILTTIFIKLQHRLEHPLIDINLFYNRNYVLTMVIRAIYMYGWVTLLFVLPLYLQNIINFTPLQAASWLLAMSVTIGMFSPFVGRILDRIGFKIPILISLILSSCSFIFLLFLTLQNSWWLLPLALFCYGISACFNVPSTMNAIITSTTTHQRSMGVGMFFSFTFITASFAVALCGAQLSIFSGNTLSHLISNTHFIISDSQFGLIKLAANGSQNFKNLHLILPPQMIIKIQPLVIQSFLHAMNYVISTCLLLLATASICCLFLKQRQAITKDIPQFEKMSGPSLS